MKYFLLKITALENTFSISEAGRKVVYKYNSAVSNDVFENISVGDIVVGYASRTDKVSYVFNVLSAADETSLVMSKSFEVVDGVSLSDGLTSKVQQNEIVEISSAEYEEIYKDLITALRESLENDSQDAVKSMRSVREKAKGGFNKIYYGAPGCGKSHKISQMLKDAAVSEENIFRVTFHPEYMNCDFVGQVLPSVSEVADPLTGEKKEVVRYQFNPGPFTLALKRAYQTSDMVYLIIEEINRGNAAAIFGDLFQLLDRVKDISNSDYSRSEYPIRNPGVQDYIVRVGDMDVVIEQEVKRSGITIPSNLTILATMNSSDQNVFTLDTAFKRRWLFEQISNDIEKDTEHKYKKWYIPGTDVTWEQFLTKLNDEILNYKVQNQTNEDKRLGKYFVTQDCLIETVKDSSEVEDVAENFAYKVLEYVWNDVCKIGRDDWFDLEKYRTLEDLIDAFVHPAQDESPLDVFQNIDFKE